MLHLWEGLVAGFAATLVMTPLMQMGTAMGMTRMNMLEMLGSMFRRDAESARRLGLALHLSNGAAFGLVYAVVWWGLDPAPERAWWLGLVFGGVHSFVAMGMMPVMGAVHPRVDRSEPSSAGDVVLPPFGLGGIGFGSLTPVGILMGHLVFGLVWGLVFWWLL